MTVHKVKNEKMDKDLYYIDIDKSSSIGILHFSKEISVWIDGDLNFIYADALTSGGWFDYNTESEFELDWPNLMVEIRTAVEKYIGDN